MQFRLPPADWRGWRHGEQNAFEQWNVNRLKHVSVESSFSGSLPIIVAPASGYRNKVNRRTKLAPKHFAEAVAIDFRHAYVQDRDVGTKVTSALKHKPGIGLEFGLMAHNLKQSRKRTRSVGEIVDDQDSM